jgi:co-chaperonin GroES (HSP10)
METMMFVKKIIWESKDDKEATVVVSDGKYDVNVFSQPCTLKDGDHIGEHIIASDIYGLEIIGQDKEEVINSEKETFQYDIIATVKDIRYGIVSVGKITFDISPLPGDFKNGDRIKFYVDKFDL